MKMLRHRFVEIKYMILDFVDHVGRAKVAEYAGTVNDKRFRWDMLYSASRHRPGGLSFDLYADGIDDTHVDTVLRNVVKELNLTSNGVV